MTEQRIYEDNVIYMTPDAIRHHFSESSDAQGEFCEFIANADDETLSRIGSVAYWDDRIWEMFNIVMLDAATYIFKKVKAGEVLED